MPLDPSSIRLIEANVPFVDLKPAQVCTSAGNTETGSPLLSDGRIYTVTEGNNMPVPTHNAYAANDMVGHWVLVGSHRQTGERHVLEVLDDRNKAKGGRDFAAHAAAGPQQSPTSMLPKHNLTAIVDPTDTDDSSDRWSVGSLWINTTTQIVFICRSATVDAAKWDMISPYSVGGALYLSENYF